MSALGTECQRVITAKLVPQRPDFDHTVCDCAWSTCDQGDGVIEIVGFDNHETCDRQLRCHVGAVVALNSSPLGIAYPYR